MSVNCSGPPPEAAEAVASVGRRARNPQGQGSRLRAELVAAADDILARTGDIEGLSLRAVAREVGIATPSIYLHFPDKRALVRAVLEARFQQLSAVVQAAISQQPDPVGKLRAGTLAYCQFATDHPHAYRVLFGRVPVAVSRDDSASSHVTAAPPQPPAAGADAFGLLVEGVQRCMDTGAVPAADPARVALNVWTALHGLLSLRSSIPQFPWPPLTQQVDDVLRGLVGLRHNPAPEQE
jgi:AcrR family transcriptional regulator